MNNTHAIIRKTLLRRGILPRIESGETLDKILLHLIENIEAQSEQMLAAIFFYNPNSKDLWVGAAPNIQPSYLKAVNGFKTGPTLPACGSAAFRRERVISHDVSVDPIWADFKKFAEEGNIRAVWSQPILDSEKNVLGTLAFYFSEPKSPDRADLIILEGAADIAALAIESRMNQFEASFPVVKV